MKTWSQKSALLKLHKVMPIVYFTDHLISCFVVFSFKFVIIFSSKFLASSQKKKKEEKSVCKSKKMATSGWGHRTKHYSLLLPLSSHNTITQSLLQLILTTVNVKATEQNEGHMVGGNGLDLISCGVYIGFLLYTDTQYGFYGANILAGKMHNPARIPGWSRVQSSCRVFNQVPSLLSLGGRIQSKSDFFFPQ